MSASTAPASKSGLYADPREDWLAQHTEEIIDPARPIVDPHHHLWDRGGLRYMFEDMVDDAATHSRRINEYEFKHGRKVVEDFLDAP